MRKEDQILIENTIRVLRKCRDRCDDSFELSAAITLVPEDKEIYVSGILTKTDL